VVDLRSPKVLKPVLKNDYRLLKAMMMKYRPGIRLCSLSIFNSQSAIIQFPQLTKGRFGQVNVLRPSRTTGTSIDNSDENAFLRHVAHCVLIVSYTLLQTYWYPTFQKLKTLWAVLPAFHRECTGEGGILRVYERPSTTLDLFSYRWRPLSF
jgi:hypothetical protein